MNILKNYLKLIKEKISLLLDLILNKDLSLKSLSYIAFLSFLVCYFIVFPFTSSIHNQIIRSILSFCAILFYSRHIYLFWKFMPPKDKRKKHKRTFLDVILLKNPKPLDKGDLVKIVIAIDLFAIVAFFEYFL